MLVMDMLSWMVPEQHRGPEARRQALLLTSILGMMIALAVVLAAIDVASPGGFPGLGPLLVLGAITPAAIAFRLSRTLVIPAHALGGGLVLIDLMVIIAQGGLTAPSLPVVLLPCLLVMSIAGRWHGAFWAMVTATSMVALSMVGELPVLIPSTNPFVDYAVPMLVSLAVLGITLFFIEGSRDRVEEALKLETERAESAMKARSQFLATMSHEIRTPMNGVLGMAELLSDSDLSHQDRERVQTIQEAGTSLMHLLDDVLDMSKLQADALRLESVPMDAAAITRGVAALFQGRAAGGDVSLLVDTPPSLWIHGDPTRVRQILSNLVSNATKFTGRGRIQIRLSQRGERWFLEVEDTGIGMSEDQLEALFQPFVQADASTTRRFGGSGLGLSIAKHLVEAMGGHIRVTSHLGVGSTFFLDFPYSPASAPTPEILAGPRGISANRRHLRVLVADDNLINQRLAKGMLESLGVRTVDLVADGAQCVSRFEMARYDLVLMDMQMPVMSGVDATKKIRALERAQRRRPTPIVALTANALAQDEQLCRDAGMDDFITKPMQRATLTGVLDQIAPDLATATDTTERSRMRIG